MFSISALQLKSMPGGVVVQLFVHFATEVFKTVKSPSFQDQENVHCWL